MIILTGVKSSIDSSIEILRKKVCKTLKINDSEIISFSIDKRSLDARKKDNILYVYNVVLELKNEKKVLKNKNVSLYEEPTYEVKKISTKKRVAVIGYGPAGIFASLCLSEANVQVDVYERGENVDERAKSVEKFWNERILNTESNVQYGEGGAGTFSDGKLTSRSKNIRTVKVFNELLEAGAPKEIKYVNNPHIGTDKLRGVVRNIRNKTIKNGANINFNSKIEKLLIEDNKVVGVVLNDEKLYYDAVVLAVGHSARDTFRMLHTLNIKVEQKPFAVGFRIEHPQTLINKAQYGENYNNPRLGSAEYRLTNQTTNRGVYTFCMCPGGFVVPSQSELDTVVVNGMSEYARDQVNANSAILVTVSNHDFGDDIFSGLEFQEEIERKAFLLGGKNYNAPIQRIRDFINNEKSTHIGNVKPSYKLGTTLSNLRELYPEDINKAIIDSMEAFNRKLVGFSVDDAILTGVETRSSSPIKILRDKETLMSVSTENLYPCGEGCGFAGGIVSAAIDGVRVSEKIIDDFER